MCAHAQGMRKSVCSVHECVCERLQARAPGRRCLVPVAQWPPLAEGCSLQARRSLGATRSNVMAFRRKQPPAEETAPRAGVPHPGSDGRGDGLLVTGAACEAWKCLTRYI